MLKIRELRTEKGWTQKELAEKMNTSPKNIWAWENEKCEPCISDLIKLARLFDVTVDYLTGNTDEMGALIQSATTSELSEDEKKLLFWFRNSNEQGRRGIMNTVESLFNALKDASKTATAN